MNKTLMAVAALVFTAHAAVAQNNLKIVVVAGEGAVNIIQQKSAVAPIVEIRDRNNLPVSGATVTFSIGGNSSAFAGGAQTLTVTTNAAGRAAAAVLNPLSGGSFQIQVSAAFQGQTAAATITQTNVLTVAQAAAVSAGGVAGASGGGAVAGGAAGAGGLSGTTIGIIGAVVAGGAVAATQVGGLTREDGAAPQGGAGGAPQAGPSLKEFSGPFSAQMVFAQSTGGIGCDSTRALTGTLKITLVDGEAKGSADVAGTSAEIGVTASPFCSPVGNSPLNRRADVAGGPGALAFSSEISVTSTGIATVTATTGWSFAGSLSGGAISGTLIYTLSTSGIQTPGGNVISGRGTVAMPVTLR